MGIYHVLFNPYADNGAGKNVCEALKTVVDGELICHDITTIGPYADFFASIGDAPLILCGGDGTLHRFVNDTEGLALPSSILYYAAGSGNDFLTDIGGKKGDAPLPIDQYIKDLPVVEVKGKTYRFLNNVGFGIDGYCCEVADKIRENSDKPINYTAIAIKGLLFHFKPRPASVTVDGVTKRYPCVWLAPTMNGRYYGGGMMAAPSQDRSDPEGKLSVMVMFKKSKIKTLMAFPTIFKGEHIKKTKMVEVITGHDIHVVFDEPCALQIDGETFLDVTEYTVHATKRPAPAVNNAEAVEETV